MSEIDRIGWAIRHFELALERSNTDYLSICDTETALTALREKRERLEPVALTLDQLELGMGVILQKPDGSRIRCQISAMGYGYRCEKPWVEFIQPHIESTGTRYNVADHNKTWLAYTHKPGGLTHAEIDRR